MTVELTEAELAALEKFRAAQKAKAEKEAKANLPGFSFRFEMNDGESVIWSGKAADMDAAFALAQAKANSENGSGILDHCKRLYQPKGRKRIDVVASSLVEGTTEGGEEEQAA